VADHEEAGRLDVQLLADVLADLHQRRLALAAGAGFRLVTDLDARQMRGQRLATGTNAWGAWFRFRNRRFQFRLNGGQVLVGILFEQATLHGGERFILDAEADALEVRQLKGEFLDFDFFEVSICLVRRALSRLIDHVTSLGQQGWIKVQSGEFGKQIHGRNYTTAPF
jgi:hypothetical protein